MELIDLGAQYATLKSRIDARIAQVLTHGAYIMGPEVAELESELAAYCGVAHAVTCANGTDALVLALRALGIGQGDAVLTTPFSFFATVEAIMLAGARPVFVDIDPASFNIDPEKLAAAARLAPDAKAVITVDLFGLPADYNAIAPLCAEHGLKLIADTAQGFGGTLDGRRAGSFGDIATTSFFPAKPLGCYGDGGALLTDDAAVAAVLRSLRVHGKGADKYDNVRIGTNSRLDTLQAAILLEKLAAFPDELVQRQHVARRYDIALSNVVGVPRVGAGFSSSWAQYSVLAASGDERQVLLAGLRDRGIPYAIYYQKPLHLQPALSGLGYRQGDFPVTEDIASRIVSLPMGPYLSDADQSLVIETVIDALKGSAF